MARHIFLTGDYQSGKSSLIETYIRESSFRIGGFRIVTADSVFPGRSSVHLIGAKGGFPSPDNFLHFCDEPQDERISERYDRLGSAALKASEDCDLLIMDEILPEVVHAPALLRLIPELLSAKTPIIGVLPQSSDPIFQEILHHPNVDLIPVTAENYSRLARRKLRHHDQVNSFGAIVLQESAGAPWVLLVHGYRGWSYPKGRPEHGETPKETATRETLEETGIRIAIDDGFSGVVPSARPGDQRTITFFLAKSLDGMKTPVAGEVRCACWLPVPEALEQIAYESDRHVLEQAIAYRNNRQ